VYVLYLVELSGGLGATPLDTELLDVADRLNMPVGVDVAKIVSVLGALPTVAAVAGVTAVVLAVHRRVAQVIVLLASLGLIYAAVHITKAAVDRPRPADPLVETSLSAYPSGHAAYATVWIAVAVMLTRRLGLAAALVVGGTAIAAAVGLSRIYLRVHYWSDVAGGWGIGVGIFGLLTAIALIVDYIRNNGGERAPEPRAPVARAER
jgi:membrane-associated phospholipid phosphatase